MSHLRHTHHRVVVASSFLYIHFPRPASRLRSTTIEASLVTQSDFTAFWVKDTILALISAALCILYLISSGWFPSLLRSLTSAPRLPDMPAWLYRIFPIPTRPKKSCPWHDGIIAVFHLLFELSGGGSFCFHNQIERFAAGRLVQNCIISVDCYVRVFVGQNMGT
jgi:hypothetical protein